MSLQQSGGFSNNSSAPAIELVVILLVIPLFGISAEYICKSFVLNGEVVMVPVLKDTHFSQDQE